MGGSVFHSKLIARLVASFLIVSLLSNCATVRTPVPPSDYRKISWPHTYAVTTKDGKVREASNIQKADSSLTVVNSSDLSSDQLGYPVTIPYRDIKSIERIGQHSILHVEVGIETGKNSGDPSLHYTSTIGVFELGYVTGELRPVRPKWGFGGTMMAALGNEARIGLKARARYRFNPWLSSDIVAGPMVTTFHDGFFNGFIGGLALNVGSSITLRSEYMVWGVNAWRENTGYYAYDKYTFIEHPAGYEQVWYNGATFRGTAAGIVLAVAGAGVIALFIWLSANPIEFGD
jgi:hypothetical protein